ncbi:MAG: hypothetical protein LC104_08040 [Bacteroidales bacterium]|nr:hypothetical protein [Bacteroidales bacterium]
MSIWLPLIFGGLWALAATDVLTSSPMETETVPAQEPELPYLHWQSKSFTNLMAARELLDRLERLGIHDREFLCQEDGAFLVRWR